MFCPVKNIYISYWYRFIQDSIKLWGGGRNNKSTVDLSKREGVFVCKSFTFSV